MRGFGPVVHTTESMLEVESFRGTIAAGSVGLALTDALKSIAKELKKLNEEPTGAARWMTRPHAPKDDGPD